ITSLFLYNQLERYFINSMVDSLTRSGYEAAINVAGLLRDQTGTVADSGKLSAYAESVSRLAGARIIFVNRQGTVIADSVRVGGRLGQNLEQEEIDAALAGEVGSGILVSER